MIAGMNLIAGLSIAICLLVCDLRPAASIEDDWTHVWAVLIVASLVPAVAFFQTSVLLNRWQRNSYSIDEKMAACRRLSVSHLLAWLSASAAIIWVLRWHDVVRGAWKIDRWPLVDEWLIFCPILISLAASWAVFYELQLAMSDSSDNAHDKIRWHRIAILNSMRSRWEFVSLRFRLCFLMVLIPISAFVLVRDLLEKLPSQSNFVSGTVTSLALTALLLAMPFLMLLIWKNGKIEDDDLRVRLQQISQAHRLHVFDIRCWHTGRQIVNAAVAGWLPGFRIIFLSDALLQYFPADEVAAVLRHEAGHLRLWHVPQRLILMVLPVFMIAFLSSAGQGDSMLAVPQGWRWLGFLFGGIMILLILRWLSHQMEFEADLYAIRKNAIDEYQQATIKSTEVCPQQSAALCNALLRLAAVSGSASERRTWLHPTIRQRLNFIARVSDEPAAANRFQRKFLSHRIRLALFFALLSGCWWLLTPVSE